MPVDKILIEYAKLHLQLVQANETIAQLQEKIKELTASVEAKTVAPKE